MFKPYMEQQRRQLEQLGTQHREHRQALDQQRQRLAALTSLVVELSQPVSGSALYHQNRNGMRRQLGTLMDMQQQETELAQLSCEHSFSVMRRQLGRVKGLEQLQEQRTAAQQRQQARREQHMLDDWSSGVRVRNDADGRA